IYVRHTERQVAPVTPSRESWVIVGRRGGKSRIAALVAVFLACLRDYSGVLAPGERGVVMVIAADRLQARVVLRYIVGLIDDVPELRALVVNRRKESLDLCTGVVIEVHTASYRTVRGYTVLAAVLDEVAFWRSEDSASPDKEVLDALRPGMATVPGAVLLAISTPYARRGEVWNAYERWRGREEPGTPLVWQADTASMNPAVDPFVIESAYAEDPVAAAAEYGAQFRSDVEAFLSKEAVDDVVVAGRRELAPGYSRSYMAFTDPSGGSQDSFTLAIAHREGNRAVLDALREVRPPFSPDSVVKDFAELLRSYGIDTVTGDHYGGEWPRERFRAHGINYWLAPEPKSAIYRAFLPAVNSGRVELLEHPRLRAQLLGLERRVARSGSDSIDHPPGAHDDLANAAAGVLGLILKRPPEPPPRYGIVRHTV
ncbi:MAG: hypothetical protein ACREMG_13235, partial [Gemmatimonadales bacterium]